ncbi:MAG: transporter substrate-binding domain-containing protein [Anaerolineaceae bacterium]|nr:transporter substrate-binding domain-containing protein [Anaerolineaceae bacterium]
MIRRRIAAVMLVFICLMPVARVIAQSQESTHPEIGNTLVVATKLIEPFVMEDDAGNLTGFSVDLWNEIARRIGVNFKWMRYETVGELIDAVESRQTDAAIAAISITAEREQRIDFSKDYYNSGLIIAVPNSSLAPFQLIEAFLNPALLQIFAGFALIILIAAHIYWLIERNRDPNVPPGYIKGIWEGIWWATVTVTTVGYGDRTPHGFAGRVMAIIWMFMGLFLIANFTASVTSVVTVQHIQGTINDLGDLRGRMVVTLEGSTSQQALTSRGITPVTRRTAEEAYAILLDGDAEAIVYDAPVLMYFAANEGAGQVNLVGNIFDPESYGIALAQDSVYREIINLAILNIMEDGTYDDIYATYFGMQP